MGITSNCVKFLNYAKGLGVRYDKTVMLGRQEVFVSAGELEAIDRKFSTTTIAAAGEKYAEKLLTALGAMTIDSLDYSDFENATIIHDLNTPIPGSLKKKFASTAMSQAVYRVFGLGLLLKSKLSCLV